MQTLAAVNEFPLIWMTYDTAVPRGRFSPAAASLRRRFVGFSAFLALSFMAAETLTRRPLAAPAVLAGVDEETGKLDGHPRTHGRRLPARVVFFAYDVLLY